MSIDIQVKVAVVPMLALGFWANNCLYFMALKSSLSGFALCK